MAVYAYAREIDVTIRIKGENGRPMPHVAAWYDNTGGQIFSDDAGILKLTVPKKDAKPAIENKNHISIEG